jgi:hypothetical protein
METKPFGVVVRDLLIERGITTGLGNPNWAEFAMMLPTLHYETLRKAAIGDRAPAEKVMLEVAEALEIDPNTFYEYSLIQARKAFDPREVGDEQALANVIAWNETQQKQPRRSAQKSRRRGTATA